MYESIGIMEAFVGFGLMVFLLVMSYYMYQASRINKYGADVDQRYSLFEKYLIDDMASKKGIDIKTEIVKENLFAQTSFTKTIKAKLLEEYFEDENNQKE